MAQIYRFADGKRALVQPAGDGKGVNIIQTEKNLPKTVAYASDWLAAMAYVKFRLP
jgi:hypothetical protein